MKIVKRVKPYLFTVILFLIASSYWIVPTFISTFQNENVVQSFTENDRAAFMTNVYGESGFSKVLNIFNLYGFWGERELWAKQFDILPNANSIVFLPVLMVIFLGIGVLMRRNKKIGIVILGGVMFSAIFSLGVADTVFQPINEFLFNNIFFWNGFRDSQKWTGMLIVFMAVGLGVGLEFILEKIRKWNENINLRIAFCSLMVICILIYTPKVLMGFDEKLRPVDYPTSWYEANEIMKKDIGQEECVAIFLPWHMYYFLGFNNNLLTANPASKFFDCRMYTSLDPEIGNIGMGVIKNEKERKVQEIMREFTKEKIDEAETILKLRELGIKYIVFTSDGLRGDRILNPKSVSGVEQIYDSVDVALFKLWCYNYCIFNTF